LAWVIFEAFKDEYTVLAQQKVAAVRASAAPEDVTAFDHPDRGWRLAPRDYVADPAHEIMQAEKARDLSLFLHLKRARDDGDLLFGLGSLHHERLANLLDAEGIAHTDMKTFLEGQRQRFQAP
jgi:hypothetical protein